MIFKYALYRYDPLSVQAVERECRRVSRQLFKSGLDAECHYTANLVGFLLARTFKFNEVNVLKFRETYLMAFPCYYFNGYDKYDT